MQTQLGTFGRIALAQLPGNLHKPPAACETEVGRARSYWKQSPRLISHSHTNTHTQGGGWGGWKMKWGEGLCHPLCVCQAHLHSIPRDASCNLAQGWKSVAACLCQRPALPSTICCSGEVQSCVATLPVLLHQGEPRKGPPPHSAQTWRPPVFLGPLLAGE